MSNLVTHAHNEFKAAGWVNEDGQYVDSMQQAICEHVIKLLEVFSNEGHSGSSAPYAINLFEKLAKFEPIMPVTGEDWEWNEVGDGVFQNNRCSRVFKQHDRFDGQPYDIDGKVFWNWSEYEGELVKTFYTNRDSLTIITFPYKPTTEYVFIPTEEYPNEVL